MKKILVIVFLFIGLMVHAHTGVDEKVSCPICKIKVTFHQTMSMTTFGSFLDFQRYGAIGDYYEEMINGCRNCYFSGRFENYKKEYSEELTDQIKTVTATFKDRKLDNVLECEIAAELTMLTEFENMTIANIYLVASYFLRTDSLQTERRKNMQLKALTYFKNAIEANEIEKENLANINYLIAELYRRTASFDLAIEYYDKAINDENKADWVLEIAQQQKKLAQKKDDNNNC